jgi:hypothetical protein
VCVCVCSQMGFGYDAEVTILRGWSCGFFVFEGVGWDGIWLFRLTDDLSLVLWRRCIVCFSSFLFSFNFVSLGRAWDLFRFSCVGRVTMMMFHLDGSMGSAVCGGWTPY